MQTLRIIALVAATATPALATTAPIDAMPQDGILAARDIADRAHGFMIGELSRDERGGLSQPKARDIGDREPRGFG